jgi:hypothetical protein
MIFTKEQLTRIIECADEVITALAGTNDDIHPDNSTKMCSAWDDLNDRNAPPSVVKKLAELALAGWNRNLWRTFLSILLEGCFGRLLTKATRGKTTLCRFILHPYRLCASIH